MRLILSNLIMPLPIFWIGLIFSLTFYILKRRKYSRILAILSCVWLLIITTPFIPDILVKNLENKYSTISNEEIINLKGNVNVLVLGGGVTNDGRLKPNDKLSMVALSRLIEGIRIHNLIDSSKLVTSGYGGKEDITSAEVYAKTAEALGVNPFNIQLQDNPKNTWEEATEYYKTFGKSDQLIVVTSANHMPRTIYLFQKAGLNPIAAPTNHLIKTGLDRRLWWVPSYRNVRNMESAIHEYVGMFWYKIMRIGKIDSK